MATKKLTKIIPDDVSEFLNQSEFKSSPKVTKTQKRQRNEQFGEEEISKLIGQYQSNVKRKKSEIPMESTKESREKVLSLVEHQLNERKSCNENLLKGLSEITTQVEADYNAMKDNEQKLEQLTGTFMKCIQQATTAYKHKFKALKELHSSFKHICDEMESDHKTQAMKLVDELDHDMKKLQEKLVADTKRSGWESLRRSIFHAMQNDL